MMLMLLLSHVPLLMDCFVCFCLSGFGLFVKKVVNGANYSKQNAAPATPNYATDANYCVGINNSLNN